LPLPPPASKSGGQARDTRTNNEPVASGAIINPRRRKPNAGGTAAARTQRVVLTRERIDGLQDLTLAQAAAAAGISPTALKRACRRLGVARWAYRRRQAESKEDRRPGPPSGRPKKGASPRGCEAPSATPSHPSPPLPPQHPAAGPRPGQREVLSSESAGQQGGGSRPGGAARSENRADQWVVAVAGQGGVDSPPWEDGLDWGVCGGCEWEDRETADDELVLAMLRWGY
jgi:hypothetical protein